MGKALGQIGAPEPPPAGIATFQILFPIQDGNNRHVPAGGYMLRDLGAPLVGKSWPVAVAPTLGGSFRPTANPLGAAPADRPVLSMPAPPRMRMPRFELAAMGGIPDVNEAAAPTVPAACESWMPVPGPQPAERFLDFSFAAAIPAPIAMRQPRFELAAMDGIPEIEEEAAPAAPAACESWMPVPGPQPAERFLDFPFAAAISAPIPMQQPTMDGVPLLKPFVRSVSELAELPDAEAVAAHVKPSMDSRPVAYFRSPALLRFSLHAIDEVATQPAAIQAPAQAGAVRRPAPMPVESMPSAPAFVATALPASIDLQLPLISCMTAQVLPQAHTVEGPQAMPVETMPSVARFVPAAIDMHPALRYPTVARFQPVEDAAEGLASPAETPEPAPVESIAAAGKLAVVPRPAAPSLVFQNFHREIRAEFGIPKVEGPAPRIAEPAAAERLPAILDPVSRLATPAGTQPERPAPAIPHPGIIPLEYYCQRISSAPIKNPQWRHAPLPMVLQRFAVPAAMGRFEDLLNAKGKRVVLPFEEIFAKQRTEDEQQGRRSKLSMVGKIAASIMVGLALWSGAKIANFSQRTEDLRAEVASSERSVAVTEARGIDPTQSNFGNGPMGKLKRAIADRAATEITDTFKGGMAAWGAEAKAYAPGWKKHPQGYVSTGEMALFKPSLQYTDYHMEFYGQIEDKSMGWVVRAQDKKNYYAMKVTVIEPGLRPIIAIEHYGVTNGKVGHTVRTPLSVMVHNNHPVHVAVDVRGNHFSAAIEGEPVDTWTDDTLAKGGVGFFSDAGERARLYWMKLSRNQDWLGRFCAYLSGDGRSPQQTAELWGPEIPHDIPEPVHPRIPDAELAAAAVGSGNFNGLSKAKSEKQYRRDVWIS